MIQGRRHSTRPSGLRPALTLVEMVISMILVAVMLVAALDVLGSAKLSQQRLSNRLLADQLAQDLMAEILQHDFADPAAGDDSFGLDAKDVGTGNRALFDDVDDYDGWNSDPPQTSDGGAIPEAAPFKRRVNVRWADPLAPAGNSGTNQQLKRIEVQVQFGGQTVSSIHALKAAAPPATEACCFGDGSSVNLTADVCLALGGMPQGPGTSVLTDSCPPAEALTRLLLVVTDAGNPEVLELTRQALIESWGYEVSLISDEASQSEFDTAVTDANVAYVGAQVDEGSLGTKLVDAPIGVVNESILLVDEFGLASGTQFYVSTSVIGIRDNGHPITAPFTIGDLTQTDSDQWCNQVVSGVASGVSLLASVMDKPSLMAADTGDSLLSGTAPARRVQMPWGHEEFEIDELNIDGLTIMQRAIEWAAETDGGGGGDSGSIFVHDITMGSRKQGKWYYGQATVWIKDGGGANVEGATVTIEWSGDVSGTMQGVTLSDGTIMFESSSVMNGGTYTCTVTSVVKDGATYNADLNVETTDSITVP